MAESFTFTAPLTFTADRINDLLCCAFEGGSNYWMRRVGKDTGDGEEVEYSYELATTKTGAVIVQEFDDDRDDGGPLHRLDRAAVQRGLGLLKDYPTTLGEIINEEDDANTGDVFLQLCLLGDVVYG